MLPAQKAHVVTCDNRHYVLQKDPGTITNSKPACYHVYSFSFSTEERKGVFLEYWKCMQRSCGVRLTSRGSFYSQLNGPSGHVHKSSTSSSIEFLLKKQYRVERVLTLDTIRPNITTSSTVKPNQIVYSQILGKTNISPITSSTEGDVLKRLLLAGREQAMTVPSTTLLSDYSRNALSLQILRHDPQSSAFKLKSDELRPLFESPRLGEGSTDTWTPPVLTPSPVDEQPPLVPVAHIEPYPDPQVMYNPYFLQQLDAHRKSPTD